MSVFGAVAIFISSNCLNCKIKFSSPRVEPTFSAGNEVDTSEESEIGVDSNGSEVEFEFHGLTETAMFYEPHIESESVEHLSVID